jgi:hypothetical protein
MKEKRKVLGSDLILKANWTEEATPQLESVSLQPNSIKPADIPEVIDILQSIYRDYTVQVGTKARRTTGEAP